VSNEFSVYQFFVDGSYERVREFVSGEEAVKAFMHYSSSVGAKIGTTVRVILTDGGDCTNMEWKHGEGITYPPELAGARNHKEKGEKEDG
jgi:hypothetical protein